MAPSRPAIAASETGDPLLLTPGPLTTSRTVKQAMVHDWGSRDATFIRINQAVLDAAAGDRQPRHGFVTVPMQGSGTFAVEAMLTTFVPRDGKVLLLINGAYGQRAKKICEIAGRAVAVHETPEDTPPDLAAVDAHARAAIRPSRHVFAVHCETTSGILNPIAEDRRAGRAATASTLLIDAMSAFGALPLDGTRIALRRGRRLVEQVHRRRAGARLRDRAQDGAGRKPRATPRRWCSTCTTSGAISTRPASTASRRRSMSSSRSTRRSRNSSPRAASPGRGGRYAENCRMLIEGMRALGFETLLPDHLQAPIIVTFRMPADPNFVFQTFYDRLKDRGYVIYPGKLTVADSLPHRLHRPALSRPHARRAWPRSARFSTRWAYVVEGDKAA